MKKLLKKLLLAATALLLSSSIAYGHSAGLAIGNPTGLNGQYHINPDKVVDLTVGYELALGELEAILNYYNKKMDHYYLSSYGMDLLYGGGVKIKDGVGVHGSLQTAHDIRDQQLELFGTLGATVYAIGREGLELDAYAGIRYLF